MSKDKSVAGRKKPGKLLGQPDKPHKLCKCDCGGQVWAFGQFGRLWSYCDRCSPVVTIAVSRGKVVSSKSTA